MRDTRLLPRTLVAAFCVTCIVAPACGPIPAPGLTALNATVGFRGDRARLGAYPSEPELTPTKAASLTQVWESDPFDAAVIDGVTFEPHLYASPLYLDEVRITGGLFTDLHVNVVFAATSNGMLYAVAASDATAGSLQLDAGTILWRVRLGTPSVIAGDDAASPAGVPLGVLGTPFIDIPSSRIYVVSNDVTAGWQAYAIDVSSGTVVAGWPIALGDAAVAPVNRNGTTAKLGTSSAAAQRGALNLSTSGDRLYVPFGPYDGSGPGWMVAIDTRAAKVSSAFSSTPDFSVDPATGKPGPGGGMWGPGGAAIDDASVVYAMTGSAAKSSHDARSTWGNTLLAWNPELDLAATYTPFSYCKLDESGVDLGGSAPVVLPDLTATGTSTPHLLAVSGHGGTVYLLDRDHLTGSLEHRPPCTLDPTTDASLLPPERRPVSFNEASANDTIPAGGSRLISTLAYFKNENDQHFLFVSDGSTSLARLKIAATDGASAYLTAPLVTLSLPFVNPGSPVVTSHDGIDPIVWVLDANTLYAIDGNTLNVVFRTLPGAIRLGGKSAAVTVARGTVFVGTDRIQTFRAR